MTKKQQSPTKRVRKTESKKELRMKEFTNIGSTPVPGMTLHQVLRKHAKWIGRLAWSPDGEHIASPSADETICISDVHTGACLFELLGHTDRVNSVAWAPNGQYLASASDDNTVCLWDVSNGNLLQTLRGHSHCVFSVGWSPDGQYIASAGKDNTVRLWDAISGKSLNVLREHTDIVTSVAWSSNGRCLASSSWDDTICLWDATNGKLLRALKGHAGDVHCVIWSLDGKCLISASDDKTVRVWDVTSGKILHILEGHSGWVNSLSLSSDGQWLASKSNSNANYGDDTVRIWRTDTWACVAVLNEQGSTNWPPGIAFHPAQPILATLGEKDTIVRIWKMDTTLLLKQKQETVHYTTAKLVLVGDSGVGKTGLGWCLAHGKFIEHSSTHGQQFWIIPELGLKRDDGVECEAVLWDLAGQPDYRLVHSLYLDDVDTALVLFDPTNRQEPLAGVDFWRNQLKRKEKNLCNTILVGARIDRGTSTLTDDELQAYCEHNEICGGYIPTSAKENIGIERLMETLKAQIPWDEMIATVTTVTFKRIKEFVLALKEKPEHKGILVQPSELRQRLQATDTKWKFNDAEMMTAIGHLETHGYVKVLHGSNGQHTVLLAPDMLVNLASSIVLEARRNPRGLGVLEEARLLQDEYVFPELKDLSEEERKILLDAATVLFIEHNLCFRETFNEQTFLIFPSLINEKRPIADIVQNEEGASYRVKGAVENVYATLVVLLGYTNTFIRTNQWQNQAQYEMGKGEICGFQQVDQGDGSIELVLFYGVETPDPIRIMFRGLFERFLSRRELEIKRYQPVNCGKCGAPLARNVVINQLSKGKNSSFCNECGSRVLLSAPESLTRLSHKGEIVLDEQQTIAQYRTAFEAALVRVKGLLRDRDEKKNPTCFISYAWGTPEHQRWVLQLSKDLRNADIDVLLDRWSVKPGDNLNRYTEQIMATEYVVVVGTPALLQKYNSKTTDPVITAELEMLNIRLSQPNKYGHTILPILVEGDATSAFTPQLQKLVYVDFKRTEQYFRQLFDMIWRLYNLPFDHPLFDELRTSMGPQKII